jgi:hypothetical protein
MQASGIPLSDGLAGNDGGGANGQALAAVRFGLADVGMSQGNHAVTISATVKDNAGTLVGKVSVATSVRVVAPSWSANPN